MLLATAAFALLAFTARRWLPDLLAFAGANVDEIEGLTGLVQLGLWVGTALLQLLWRRATKAAEVPPSTQIEVSDRGVVATQGGTAAGQLAVGGGVGGSVFNHSPVTLNLGPSAPSPPPPPRKPSPPLASATFATLSRSTSSSPSSEWE